MARSLKRRASAAKPSPTSTRAATASRPGRIPAVDALRGLALCLMFVYHFAFDLRYYGVLRADFENDPFWLGFRGLIVSSFMGIAGVSLVLAANQGVPGVRFLRRVGLIAAGALAATAASWIVFPQTFIYFGILHCIAVASLLAWPLRRFAILAGVIGIVVVVAGMTLSSPYFDARTWSWIGFMTHKPATEDYVPLAPWAGVMFLGVAAGHGLMRSGFRALAPLANAPRWLQWLGQHSLIVYLVHQPLLLGLLWLVLGR